jgi:hypothetical protein
MHDVSRQSRHTRVITQVIDASSLGPVIRTAARQSSIRPTYLLLVGRLGRCPVTTPNRIRQVMMGWNIMVGSRSGRWV